MGIEFQSVTIKFGPEKDAAPTVVSADTDNFSGPITTAQAMMTGWALEYDDDDHEVFQEFAKITDTNIVINENKVRVFAEMGIRDKSGTWDDSYSGEVQAVVMAVIED